MKIEDPVVCLSCGLETSADALLRSSLDAYADLSVDYDLFCPRCESQDLKFLPTRERKE